MIKISVGNVSGMARSKSMRIMIEAFKKSPIISVGFGTAMGYDLFSTWLAEVGIVGVTVYVSLLYEGIKGLLNNRDTNSYRVLILILVSNMIMFASVPEFMQVFSWVYVGLAYYLFDKRSI